MDHVPNFLNLPLFNLELPLQVDRHVPVSLLHSARPAEAFVVDAGQIGLSQNELPHHGAIRPVIQRRPHFVFAKGVACFPASPSLCLHGGEHKKLQLQLSLVLNVNRL